MFSQDLLCGSPNLPLLLGLRIRVWCRRFDPSGPRRSIGHSEVGTNYFNNYLSMLHILLSQSLKRVKAAESNGRFFVPQLIDGLTIEFRHPAFGRVMHGGIGHYFGVCLNSLCALASDLVQALAPVGGDQCDQGSHASDYDEYELQEFQL